jgi:hypothetical protein
MACVEEVIGNVLDFDEVIVFQLSLRGIPIGW